MKKAKLSMIAAMAIFGTIGLFKKQIPLSSGEIALYRAVLAAAVILVALLVTKQKLPLRSAKKELPLLLFSGAAMGFNWILLFEAYEYTTVSAATLSYYFAPVLVTVACPILFKERAGAKQWICSIMATVGIVMITGLGDPAVGGTHLIGIGFGLGAAVLYATVVLLNKYIKNVSGIHRTLLQFFAAIVVLVPYVVLTGPTEGFIGGKGLVFMLVVGLIHTGLAYCMYFTAMKDLPGQKVAILSYIDPLVAILLSALLLKEAMTPVQIVGGVLILGFTLLNEIEIKRPVS